MNRRILTYLLLPLTLAGAGATIGDATEVVEIRLRGRYYMEPATVHILVAVEPDADNRVLRVEADGDQLFRASELALKGADEKRLHTVEFRNLPAGRYTLRAEVMSNRRVRGAVSDLLIVNETGLR